MRKMFVAFIVSGMLTLSITAAETGGARPAEWAQPLKVSGAPNLHKVSDSLYRSAQPTAEGFKNLKAMGIKTVINLRAHHSDKDEIGNTDLKYVSIPMNTWNPRQGQLVEFLKIVTNPENTPVLIHCQHGADRSGAMTAAYRLAIQGWSKENAIKEMTDGGFGFHSIWTNLVRWVEELNVKALRDAAEVKVISDKKQ